MQTVIMSAAPSVRWRQLEPEFIRLFPRTLEDVYNTGETALVNYCGFPFYIRPVFETVYSELYTGGERRALSYVNGFEVWGAPAINQFPDPK